MFRTAAVAILTLSLSDVSVFAADGADEAHATTAASASTAEATTMPALGGDVDWSLEPIQFGSGATRPAVLPALYASLAGLQAFDGYSTQRGLSQGAREANGLMSGVVGHPAAFWGLKAATTVLPILVAEHLWHTNRAGAVLVMVLANGAMAAVAANNARVLRQQR